MKKILLIALIVVNIFCLNACTKHVEQNIENTEKNVEEKIMVMENFSCETNKGDKFELYNRKGKPAFINFWATWCGPCVGEMPELQDIYDEYSDKVDFVFINCGDSKDIIDKFLDENEVKYTFPIGYDLSDKLSIKFNITAIPTTYILNEKNEVSDVLVGARSGAEYKRYIEKVLN